MAGALLAANTAPPSGRSRGSRPGGGAAVPISFGLTTNLRTAPIIEGRMASPSFKPVVTAVGATELFLRQLRDAEFDVAEMSMSSLLIALAGGDQRFVALPIFTTRYFFHTYTLVRRDAGIQRPEDLKGRRIGVPEFQQTGALWIRGILQDEYGLKLRDVEHWMEHLPGASHAGAIGYRLPDYVHQIPQEKSIGSMMLSGELDAAIMYGPAAQRSPINRSIEKLREHPSITTLYPDTQAENLRYFAKTGFHPINHCVVIKRDVLDMHPDIEPWVIDLFERANAVANRERAEHIDYHHQIGLIDTPTRDILLKPLVNYGIANNRAMIETVLRYSHEQGLTPQRFAVSDVFRT
jgi:4,5-dihydroxyphthalate decarboxylase